MAHDHEESLFDKIKNALGMGGEEPRHDERDMDDERPVDTEAYGGDGTDAGSADESGLGRNPGPIGSAQYEDGASPADLGGTDYDPDGTIDTTREDAHAAEFAGAYGPDDTPLPTSAAWDRGEAPPPDLAPETENEEPGEDRRETGP